MAKTPGRLSRRQFLEWLGIGGLVAAAGCSPLPEPTSPPISTATLTHLPPTATPTRAATLTPKPATPTSIPRAAVALRRVKTYDAKTLRTEWRAIVDSLGGLSGLVKPGAKVGVKVNLTGGPSMDAPGKPPAPEYFVTHPAVAGVICEWLKDSGAGTIYIMDGIADETAWQKWGYTDMAKPLGAKLINLSKPAPYSSFGVLPVGKKAQIYNEFLLNRFWVNWICSSRRPN